MEKTNSNKRVCGLVIDFFIVTLISLPFNSLLHINTANPFFYLLFFLFYVFRDSYQGQSPGKMLVGLRVVDSNNSPISYIASFKRNIILFWPNILYVFVDMPKPEMYTSGQWNTPMTAHTGLGIVALVILIIEYIAATRSKDGRRMGDIIAGTKVVDLKPETPAWIFVIIAVGLILAIVFLGMLMQPKV